MNTPQYETANSWMSAMHEKKHTVSIVLCQAIEKLMKDKKVSFAEAFKMLDDNNRVSYNHGDYGLKEDIS